MPRPRRDGRPPRAPSKLRLTDRFVRTVAPGPDRALYWDAAAPGLALAVHRTGRKTWRFTYRAAGRLRILTIGRADAIGLADARDAARDLLGRVARGADPQAEKMRGQRAETFGDVAARYREHIRKVNKSWRQADALTTRHLLPRWGTLRARDVTRPDVRALMRKLTGDNGPVAANQTLAAASAIFTWAIREEVGDVTANPCSGIARNATTARERVVREAEMKPLWAALDDVDPVRAAALRVLLLCGQRPGEVAAMRREHVRGGWWELPGKPDAALGWPGTKNGMTHRVWLTEPARALIAEGGTGRDRGFVFSAHPRGTRPIGPHALSRAMRAVSAALNLGEDDAITPHDLRRTHGTTVTGLGFGREAMNRIQNHKEGGIADVYDRHNYDGENKCVQEGVTRKIMGLIGRGLDADNVVGLRA